MGIDISHSFMVGATYGELEDFFDKSVALGSTDEHEGFDSCHDVIEYYLESASPYFDACYTECFYGFCVENLTEPNEDWYKGVKAACERFELLTGVRAKVRGGANVW